MRYRQLYWVSASALMVLLILRGGVVGVQQAECRGSEDERRSDARELRRWSDATGKYSVEATFVELRDGNVRIRRKSGRVISVPIDRLSKADQRYVRDLLKRERAARARSQDANEANETGKSKPAGSREASSLNLSGWSQFRGPGGQGRSLAKGLPIRWSADTNIVWKTDLPGAGASSPVTWGDRVFVTCHTGYGVSPEQLGEMEALARRLICVNRSDGRVRWFKEVDAVLPETEYRKRMFAHGYASSTPAVDAERVYCFFGKSGVVAFSHTGEQLWRTSVGTNTHGWGSAASVVLYKNLVIVNACVESGSLVALNRETGKEVWRAGGIDESWNTPILVNVDDGKQELVVAIAGKMLGFDPDSGKQLWSCNSIEGYVAPSLVAHDGVVFCTAGRVHHTIAIRAGGRGDVTATHVVWRANKGSNVASPVYHDGYLYIVHDMQGIAYCLNAQTGEVVYEQRLAPRPGNIYASALLVDGNIYYVGRYGAFFVVAAKPRYELVAHSSLRPDRFFNSTPIVSRGQLLLRSDRFLYCIGTK